MTQLSEMPASVTPHTFETPDELWEDWKAQIPRKYSTLGDGIVPLLAADAICRSRHRRSLIAVLIDEEYFTEAELDAVIEGGLDALDTLDSEYTGQSQDVDLDQDQNQDQDTTEDS